jgi:hypothetical protein
LFCGAFESLIVTIEAKYGDALDKFFSLAKEIKYARNNFDCLLLAIMYSKNTH